MIDEARDLYAIDPAGFVAARTQLVRRLKADKRKDDAAEVAKLQRPRLGEYVLNRLARDDAEVVAAFAAAVAAATAAQSDAIGSGDASALRTSSTTLRTASAALLDASIHLLQREHRDGPGRRDEMLTVIRSLTDEQGAASMVAGVVGSGQTRELTELFAGAPEPHIADPRPTPRPAKPAARKPEPAERTRTEPTRTEPTRTEPTRTEPTKAVQPIGPSKAQVAKEVRRRAQLERATAALAKTERAVTVAQRAVDAASTRLADARAAREQAAAEVAALGADATA